MAYAYIPFGPLNFPDDGAFVLDESGWQTNVAHCQPAWAWATLRATAVLLAADDETFSERKGATTGRVRHLLCPRRVFPLADSWFIWTCCSGLNAFRWRAWQFFHLWAAWATP